jgi:hypothetical protein
LLQTRDFRRDATRPSSRHQPALLALPTAGQACSYRLE